MESGSQGELDELIRNIPTLRVQAPKFPNLQSPISMFTLKRNRIFGVLFFAVCLVANGQNNAVSGIFMPDGGSLSGSKMVEVEQGKYLVCAGYVNGQYGMPVLIKSDAAGNTIWAKAYNPGFQGSFTHAMFYGGAYYLSGTIQDGSESHSIFLMKTDTAGTQIWTRRIWFQDISFPVSLNLASDGKLLMAGRSYTFSDPGSSFVLKADTSGEILWSSAYTLESDMVLDVRDCQTDADGRIWMTGIMIYPHEVMVGNPVSFICQLNSEGIVNWAKTLVTGDSMLVLNHLLPHENACYAAGTTGKFDTDALFLIKVDQNGEILFQKSLGNEDLELNQKGLCFVQGDELLISGSLFHDEPNADSDVFLCKTNLNAELVEVKSMGSERDEYAQSAWYSANGGQVGVLCVARMDLPTKPTCIMYLRSGQNLELACQASDVSFASVHTSFYTENQEITRSEVTANSSSFVFQLPTVAFQDTLFCQSTLGLGSVVSKPLSIRAFPNPGNGVIRLIYSGTEKAAFKRMYLSDVSGRVIQFYGKGALPDVLSLGSYPGGCYFLVAESNEGEYAACKIIIQ